MPQYKEKPEVRLAETISTLEKGSSAKTHEAADNTRSPNGLSSDARFAITKEARKIKEAIFRLGSDLTLEIPSENLSRGKDDLPGSPNEIYSKEQIEVLTEKIQVLQKEIASSWEEYGRLYESMTVSARLVDSLGTGDDFAERVSAAFAAVGSEAKEIDRTLLLIDCLQKRKNILLDEYMEAYPNERLNSHGYSIQRSDGDLREKHSRATKEYQHFQQGPFGGRLRQFVRREEYRRKKAEHDLFTDATSVPSLGVESTVPFDGREAPRLAGSSISALFEKVFEHYRTIVADTEESPITDVLAFALATPHRERKAAAEKVCGDMLIAIEGILNPLADERIGLSIDISHILSRAQLFSYEINSAKTYFQEEEFLLSLDTKTWHAGGPEAAGTDQETWERADRLLNESLLRHALGYKDQSATEAVALTENLLSFKHVDLMPLSLLATYCDRYAGNSWPRAKDLASKNSPILEYCMEMSAKLPEDDSLIPKPAGDAVRAIRDNPVTFNEATMENPAIAATREAFLDDPEFYLEGYHPQTMIYEISEDGPHYEMDSEGTVRMNISNPEYGFLEGFSAGQTLRRGTPEFAEFTHQIVRHYFGTTVFYPQSLLKKFERNGRTEGEGKLWPLDDTLYGRLCERHNLDPKVIAEGYGEWVNNPVNLKIRSDMTALARHYLDSRDPAIAAYAVRCFTSGSIGCETEDMELLIKALETADDPTLQVDVTRFLLNRLDSPLSPQIELGTLLQFYSMHGNMSPEAQELLRAEAYKPVNQLVDSHEQHDLAGISGILGLTTQELSRALDYMASIRREGIDTAHGLNSGNFTHYLAQGKIPGALEVVNELVSEYGYEYSSYSSATETVLAQKEEVLSSLCEIKAAFPDFTYRLGNPTSYADIDPYVVLARTLPHGKLLLSLAEAGSVTPAVTSRIVGGLFHCLGGDTAATPAGSAFEGAVTTLLARCFAIGGDLAALQDFYGSQQLLERLARNPGLINGLLELGESGMLRDRSLHGFYLDNAEALVAIPPEKRESYASVLTRVAASPSQEVQRIKDQLLHNLILSDDPVGDYDRIEQIFIRNHLPTVGKTFRVFDILYPSQRLDGLINERSSPYLRQASARRRRDTIYRDLLKVHVDSGNRSLRDYIQAMKEGEKAVTSLEEKGFQGLSEDERLRLGSFVAVLRTLYQNSQLGHNVSLPDLEGPEGVVDGLRQLINDIGLEPGQSISNRVAEMYLKPIGLHTFDEALERMAEAKLRAHERSLKQVGGSAARKLTLAPGDALKGVNIGYISNILQNGSVAKEFLGSSSDSDYTPLDTDISLVLEGDASEDAENVTPIGLEEIVDRSMAVSYGQLLLALRNRGQYQVTDSTTADGYDLEKMEMFQTGGDRHYGVRTGIPTTEIDFMIALPGLVDNPKALDGLYFQIAQNGYYLPVTDKAGVVIFSSEDYEEHRRAFVGLDRFDGEKIDLVTADPASARAPEILRLGQEIRADRERVETLFSKIMNVVREVLEEEGVRMKRPYDKGLLGAELQDTGSTGRHTNKAGDYDFDLSLKLDQADMAKVPVLVSKIRARLKPERDDSHSENSGYFQMRSFGCAGLDSIPLDIDIGFSSKSELAVFGSHDAIREKLDNILANHGEEAYYGVLANIVLAKQVLTEGKAYKKADHGGLGGIGVENWLLLNGGDIEQAFRTFRDAAYEDGKEVPFERFRERYKIRDGGVNIKYGRHDEFVSDVLKPDGYAKMLLVIRDFLGSET